MGSYENDSGTTKRLVKVTSPFWSDQTMATFSQEVLSYAPIAPTGLNAKSRQYFNHGIRRTKLGILTSLPADRTSYQVRKSITEEGRRFSKAAIGATVHEPGFIGSPIAAQNLGLASDADILNAFREIPMRLAGTIQGNGGRAAIFSFLANSLSLRRKTRSERYGSSSCSSLASEQGRLDMR